MEYFQLIKERYSVRTFSQQAVEDDTLAAILEAARLAPTAVNKQPHRLLVLRGEANMEKLKSCTPYTFHAPMAIAVCYMKDEAWVRSYDNANSGLVDATIVGTHIMLAVHALGLGTTWVGHFEPAAFRKTFNLPDMAEPVAIFPIGHPAENASPAPKHNERRPLDETVIYDSF